METNATHPTSACADCPAEAVTRCTYCEAALCAEHTNGNQFAARNLFGPYLIPKDAVVCAPCYGERLWLAWRALVVIISGLVTVGIVFTQPPLFAIVPLVVGTVLWILAAGPLKTHRQHKENRARATG